MWSEKDRLPMRWFKQLFCDHDWWNVVIYEIEPGVLCHQQACRKCAKSRVFYR